MVKPTAAQQLQIAELEDHAATLGRLLDILRIGLHNARDPRTIREIEAEITYTIERLAEVQARRDRLRRDLDRA